MDETHQLLQELLKGSRHSPSHFRDTVTPWPGCLVTVSRRQPGLPRGHWVSSLYCPFKAGLTMSEPSSRPPAQSAAERARAYRQRQRQKGLKPVKLYLTPEAMAYLDALCVVHELT